MIKVGLTGGIGSGKSFVANIFSTLGVPVFDADTAARILIDSDAIIREKIIAGFGKDAYNNGTLNRAYIAAIVFNNNEKLKMLNAITHPAVLQQAQAWFGRQQTMYAIKEAALLFESGGDKELDYIIGVAAPLETRISRAMQRDNATRDAVLARINRQMPQEEKMQRCNAVIDNAGEAALLPQVMEIHANILAMAKAT